MPTVLITPYGMLSNANWSPSTGSYSGGPNFTNYPLCVSAIGSGNFLLNFPGFGTVCQWYPFLVSSVIDPASTINAVQLQANFQIANALSQVNIQYNPPFGPDSGQVQPGTGTHLVTLDLTGTMPTVTNLDNSIFKTAASNSIAALVGLDFVAYLIDYTPPSTGIVLVHIAGAYPVSCPQPPAKRFRPFGLFDPSLGLDQVVTAAWMLRYGKPPPGFQIWGYYRAASTDFVPGQDSPTTTFTIGPW